MNEDSGASVRAASGGPDGARCEQNDRLFVGFCGAARPRQTLFEADFSLALAASERHNPPPLPAPSLAAALAVPR